MQVKYTAGAPALTVETVGAVERGQVVEVDDTLGKQLVAQGWEQVTKTTAKKTTKESN